jgi:hypothetical protein
MSNNLIASEIDEDRLINDESYFRQIEAKLPKDQLTLPQDLKKIILPAWLKWNQKIRRGDTDQEDITGELTKFGFAKFFDQISQLFMRN